MKKFILLTSTIYPFINGASIITGNLFKYIQNSKFSILTSKIRDKRIDERTRLNSKYHYVKSYKLLDKFILCVNNISKKYFNSRLTLIPFDIFYLLLPIIIIKGIKAMNTEKAQTVFTTFNLFGPFQVSAYIICILTSKPLFIYIIDVWEETHQPIDRFFAKLFEERLIKKAKKIFVMSEALQEHFFYKYTINTILLPTSVDNIKSYPPDRLNKALNKKTGNLKIVFTGTIYEAVVKPLANLLKVINSFPNENIRLVLGTLTSEKYIKENGIWGKNVEVRRIAKRDDVFELQKSADILFVPHSHCLQIHKTITRTMFPTKMVEYLKTGKPILVSAPKDTIINYYARKHKYALVVDTHEISDLRDTVKKLVEDKDICNQLIINAWKTVTKNHDSKIVSQNLIKTLI